LCAATADAPAAGWRGGGGAGGVEGVITSELFQVPTTAARSGSRLAVVNAKFDTGIPPTADQYEVIVVDREHGSPPIRASV
jgi:hypothetical protein